MPSQKGLLGFPAIYHAERRAFFHSFKPCTGDITADTLMGQSVHFSQPGMYSICAFLLMDLMHSAYPFCNHVPLFACGAGQQLLSVDVTPEAASALCRYAEAPLDVMPLFMFLADVR